MREQDQRLVDAWHEFRCAFRCDVKGVVSFIFRVETVCDDE